MYQAAAIRSQLPPPAAVADSAGFRDVGRLHHQLSPGVVPVPQLLGRNLRHNLRLPLSINLSV